MCGQLFLFASGRVPMCMTVRFTVLFCNNPCFFLSGIDGANFPHKRNYPDVAYKSHEFFDASLAKPDRMPRVRTVYTFTLCTQMYTVYTCTLRTVFCVHCAMCTQTHCVHIYTVYTRTLCTHAHCVGTLLTVYLHVNYKIIFILAYLICFVPQNYK